MRQQGTDVGHEGQIARLPQAPAQGRRRERPGHGEQGLRAGEPGGREQRRGCSLIAGVHILRTIQAAFSSMPATTPAIRINSGGQTGKV